MITTSTSASTSLRAAALTLALALALALVLGGCDDDAAPYADADAGLSPDADLPDALPCPRLTDAPYVRSATRITQATLWWDREAIDACIPLSLDTAGTPDLPRDAASGAVWRAVATWTDAAAACAAPLCFREGPPSTRDAGLGYTAGALNTNLVTWTRDAATWDAFNNPDALAITLVTQDASTGRILDADLELNNARYTFTDSARPDAWDLESVVVHELGHLLGFDHTPDTAAVMFGAPPDDPATTRRSLNATDTAGLCEAFACYAE